MREIKFRAWDKNKNLWLEPSCVHLNGRGLVLEYKESLYVPNPHSVEINLFTGLKDKNGKEIYEGDIVRLFESTVSIVKYGHQDISHDWQGVGFFTREKDESQFNIFEGDGIEVIGNIHENPELLK